MRYPNYVAAGVLAIIAGLLTPGLVLGHCEIPCGIYDDEARLNLLAEHITTIEKSMTEIVALSAAGDKNYNQLVRWVMNKEDHANQYMDVVTQYFMTQRIKPVEPAEAGYDKYVKSVTLLQQMLVSAMKCKQTTDAAHTAKLKQLLDEFRTLYLGDHGHSH
jgi:nickel superoxide dismutase